MASLTVGHIHKRWALIVTLMVNIPIHSSLFLGPWQLQLRLRRKAHQRRLLAQRIGRRQWQHRGLLRLEWRGWPYTNRELRRRQSRFSRFHLVQRTGDGRLQSVRSRDQCSARTRWTWLLKGELVAASVPVVSLVWAPLNEAGTVPAIYPTAAVESIAMSPIRTRVALPLLSKLAVASSSRHSRFASPAALSDFVPSSLHLRRLAGLLEENVSRIVDLLFNA